MLSIQGKSGERDKLMNYTDNKKVLSQTATTVNAISSVPQELMTESELITFLRIPEVSKATDYHNVVANLKRMHDLPCIHICGQPLYPKEAILDWIRDKTSKGN